MTLFFRNVNSTGTEDLIWFKGNGRIGVGTSSPMELFELKNANPVMTFHSPSVTSFKVGNDGTIFKIAAMDDGYGGHDGSFAANDVNVLSMLENGNVGIGTTTPRAKLDVVGGIIGTNSAGALIKIHRKQGHASIQGWSDGTSGYDGQVIIEGATNSDAIFLNHYGSGNVNIASGGGNIGIGTTAGSDKVNVNGAIFSMNSNGSNLKLKRKQGQATIKGVFDGTAVYDSHAIIDAGRTSDAVYLNNYISSNTYINNGGGNVGIGTINTHGYKLAVNGKIISEEIKVELATNWPDYVFTPSYDLKSLDQVETFINENGHLPNIPSAQEVEENNGIELGEMNAKLLEKIEELTLHLIEKDKQLKTQDSKLKTQDQLIQELFNRIEKLENQ